MKTDTGAGASPLRLFGEMLRWYRTQAGLTPEGLGQRIYLSGSLIRKVEDGTRAPTEELTRACESVPELCCNGALFKLWDILADYLKRQALPGWFAGWAEREAHAAKLRWFELSVVPGLLQTEAYARALLTGRIGFNGDVDQVVSARMARRDILDRDQPPELWAVIDEAALRRPVGGGDVMAAQLDCLIEPAQRPNIVLRVIPASVGVHDGMSASGFIIAEFTDDTPVAAYQDTAIRGQITEDPDDVGALAATWDRLAAEALPRSASLALIKEIQASWT